MTLTDPCEALAEQSNFVGYLVGLAGLARVVQMLASDGNRRAGGPREADNFVHLLVGLASVGATVERLAESTTAQGESKAATPIPGTPFPATIRWLR